MPWTLTILFALSALVLGVLYQRGASRDSRVLRAEILPPANTEFHLNVNSPGPVSVSPDGRCLVFAAREKSGTPLLYVRELDSPLARPLPGTEGGAYPFWSPDGRMIGFFADEKLKKINVAGGVPSSLCGAPSGKGGTWNREGTILFAPSFDSPIYRVPAVGGPPRAITELDSSRGDNSHRFPVFLPDGRSFLFFARSAAAEKSHAVVIARLDEGGGELLMNGESNVALAAAHLLFLREGTLMARPFDIRGRRFAGAAFPVVEGVKFLSAACLGVFSASEDGLLVYEAGGSGGLTQLVWLNGKGERLGVIGEPAEHEWAEPRLSPDERSVAATILDVGLGTHDVWVYDIARDLRTRLTFDPADEVRPVWSPDGESLVFSSRRRGHYDLYRISVTRPGSEELLFESLEDKLAATWSPDGHFIVYVAGGDLWVLPTSKKEDPFPLVSSEFRKWRACFSPDGRWLVYDSEETGREEVFATSFPQADRKWQVSVGGGFWPMWTGQEIFYVSLEGILQSVSVRTEGSSLLFDAPEPLYDVSRTHGGTMSRDGQRSLCFLPIQYEGPPQLHLIVNWPATLDRP